MKCKTYILGFFLPMIVNGYAEKIRELVFCAQKYGFRISPEKIYLRRNGIADADIMIQPIRTVYATLGTLNLDPFQAAATKTLSVEQFLKFASDLNDFEFQKKNKRPMT